ncbi:hypothetical protein JCM3775_006306 [Rhodotorula graminis]
MSLHDTPRYRQSHGQAAARADHLYDDPAPALQPHDPRDPYVGNGYHASGAAYRSRSPEGGTLTALLSNVARTAQQTFSSSSSSSNGAMPFSNRNGHGPNGGAWSNFVPKLAPSSSPGPSSSAPASLAAYLPSTSTAGFIFLCCLWYLSSAFSSNTGKSILTRFRYPVTLTFVQFAFVAGYCVVVLFVRERLGGATGHASGGLSRRRMSVSTMGGWGIRKPSRHMFHGTFMMSLFQIAGHVFSSMAIARVPVSTVHTIKALSPLFTVLSYAALFGVRYSTATYVALLPLTVGVMLACSFDLRANAVGFLCALGSTFIFVAQNIFSKKLLPKENTGAVSAEEKAGPSSSSSSGDGSGTGVAGSAKLDKLNLLLYSSGMAFFLMIPIWLYSDASALFFAPAKAVSPHASAIVDDSPTRTLVFYFFANGTVHFAQNLLAFSLLARTSPVTYSIASLVKRIAVICIAIVWSGQHVSLVQAVGMTSTFGGLWMYNRAKSDVDKGEKRRTQVEKRHDMSLPTTVGDVRDLDGGVTPPPPSSLPSGAYAGGPTSPRAPAPPHAHSHPYGADPSSHHVVGASSVYASPALAPSAGGGGGGHGSHAHNSPYAAAAAPQPHHVSASASAHTSPGVAAGRHPNGGSGLTNGFTSSGGGGGAPSSSSIGGGPSMARNRTASASREPPRDRSAVAAMEQWEKAHAGGGAHTVPASLFSSPVSVGGEGAYR